MHELGVHVHTVDVQSHAVEQSDTESDPFFVGLGADFAGAWVLGFADSEPIAHSVPRLCGFKCVIIFKNTHAH